MESVRGTVSEHRVGLGIQVAGLAAAILPPSREPHEPRWNYPSKRIAHELGISQRTVENHRSTIMRKAGVRSVAALIRMVLVPDCASA